MFIACIVVVAVFIIFIATTYLITRKSFSFEVDGKMIKVANAGSACKVFIDNRLIQTYHMPQLIRGESFKIKVEEKEVVIKCKTNWYGNKMSMSAFIDEKEVYNNGIKVK